MVSRYQREDGQALAEYGLLLALIAVVCILALTALGLAIAGTLSALLSRASRIDRTPDGRDGPE
ncbi:MAG: Flp family type IVb pilin [Chloroflexi bacterium]|nr:MAG: Flp family type IVb pilin [Chloroflexota bacterium]